MQLNAFNQKKLFKNYDLPGQRHDNDKIDYR